MSNTWLDDPASEASDPLTGDYGEADFGGVGGEPGEAYSGDPPDDAEAWWGARRARAKNAHALRAERARRAASAQRTRNGSAPPPTTAAAVRSTQAAVREVDLATKVQADTTGAALAAQGKRITGVELALVTSLGGKQLEESFPGIVENRLVAAGLRAAPMLALKPARRGSGLGGYARNPQVLGVAAFAGLLIAGELTRKRQQVEEVRITRSERELPVNSSIRFRADAFDDDGRVISEKRQSITWESNDPNIVGVEKASGVVTANSTPGTVTIKATGERADLFDQVLVTVNDGTLK